VIPMPNNHRKAVPYYMFTFPKTHVTWAGAHPQTRNFCFGTEDGSVSVRNMLDMEIAHNNIIASQEAINGIAFSHDMMAVSTRAELLVRQVVSSSAHHTILYPSGSHGVIAMGQRGFIAPLGSSGAMTVIPLPNGGFRNRVFRRPEVDLYFYKMKYLGSTPTGDSVVACAGRTDGIMVLSVAHDGTPQELRVQTGHTSDNTEQLDIVDVCRLTSAVYPYAAVALGIDNSLYFCRDLLHHGMQRPPIRFNGMIGTGYTILSDNNHIYVLTSEVLYIFYGLATRFLSDEHVADAAGCDVAIQAADLMIAYNKYLLLLIDHGVMMYKIDDIINADNMGANTGHVLTLAPDLPAWDWQSPTECTLVELFA
jgi:hypothetical protein